MTSIIKYSLKELEDLVMSDRSCVKKEKLTQNIAFQPWCLTNLKDSLEKIMNKRIGKYDEQMDGIILSYKNVKILDDVYAINKDCSELRSDIEADFYVFHPHVGADLCGTISKKCNTHLGVLVHKVFNVVIPTPPNETSATWVGLKLNVGQQVVFKVAFLDLFGALPYIRGELDENFLPPINEDEELSDGEKLNSTHVNFEGIKPKAYVKNVDSMSNQSSPVDKKKEKKSKAEKKEELMSNGNCTDSDIVPDVDDELLTQQDKVMKKAMISDKKKNKHKQILTPSTPGLKKLLDGESKGISKKYTPPPSNKVLNDSIVIRNKKISLSNHFDKKPPDDADFETSQTSVTSHSKQSKDNSCNNSPSTSSKDNSLVTLSPKNVSVKLKDTNRHSSSVETSVLDDVVSEKKSKKRHSASFLENGNSQINENNDYSRELDISRDGSSQIKSSKSGKHSKNCDTKSSTPVKDNEINFVPKKDLDSKETVFVKLKDKKRHSSFEPSILNDNINEKKEKKRHSAVVLENGSSQVDKELDESYDEKRKRKLERKRLKLEKRNSSHPESNSQIESSCSRDSKKSEVSSSANGQGLDATFKSPKVKRKRKYSESFEETTSEPPVKKKKEKRKSEAEDNVLDSEDRMKKVQDLLIQIASDPTLLTDIQSLIKSRKSK